MNQAFSPDNREPLVDRIADQLRERIFATEPGARIGSLRGLAESLGVGIVTLQQAARVLEHEGLLSARRGPGGGYYGERPDGAALERAMRAFMRANPASYEEALDMTSLLFTELATTAAECRDELLRGEMRSLVKRLDSCDDQQSVSSFESDFQELLFQMVERPLFEMLTRVTLHYSEFEPATAGRLLHIDRQAWQVGRHRIIAAILANDAPLARFEADRSNRSAVMQKLRR